MIPLNPIAGEVYFCKGLCIDDKTGQFGINWNELTIDEGIRLAEIELDKSFIEFYQESDIEKRKLLVEKFTDEEINGSFPKIYREVIEIITNIPSQIINALDNDSLSKFYHTYASSIHLSCNDLTPTHFEAREGFIFGGCVLKYPKSVSIFGEDVPMYYETALTFCESLDMTKLKARGIPIMMGIFCRKQGETYNQDTAISRSEKFKDMPMTNAWNMLLIFNKTVEYIESHHKWIFGSSKVEAKIKNAYNRSGLNEVGSMSFIYEVAGETNETLEDIKNMPLYEFLPLLSYIRSKDKLKKYAQ